MVLQTGDLLGPYQITGQVGSGGMATVYKAHHTRLGRDVAVKVMHQAFLQDDSFLARFEREARIVARLEHPNIVPIYDYDEVQGMPFLVMKYVDGMTLKQRALKVGLTLEESAALLTQVADALDFAHSRDILHRDIKPSNILIDQEGLPYITDFGLARIAQAGESTISTDMMLGTPYYISPEQARGEKNLDRRTDVYSLGVVLYELVTGQVPFSADTPYAIVHGHIYQAPKAPGEVNPELPVAIDQVLLRALAKNPDDRYESASAMIAAFREALDASRVDAPLPTADTQDPARPVKPAPAAFGPPKDVQPAIEAPKPKRRFELEASIDLGNFKFNNLGQRIEEGVRNIATTIEENVEGYTQEERERRRDMSLSEEERLRRRAEKKIEARTELQQHLAAYVMVNAVLWIIYIAGNVDSLMMSIAEVANDPDFTALIQGGVFDFPWPMFVTFFWGIGMVSHWVEYRNKHGAGAQRHEAEIQRELARMRGEERDQDDERSKAKRKQKNRQRRLDDEADDLDYHEHIPLGGVRLTQDGELTDSFIEEVQEPQERQQGRRRG